MQDRNHGQDIYQLWNLLADRFPTKPKLDQRIHAVSNFEYRPYRSMRTHCSHFRDLTAKIDEEIKTNVILNHQGRLPHYIPTVNDCYDHLLESIECLPLLHDKVRTWEVERNQNIFDACYERTQDDFDGLEDMILKAEKLIYPNNMLQHQDLRARNWQSRKHPLRNYHFYAPYGKVTPRRNRFLRGQDRRARRTAPQRRIIHTYLQNTACHACGRNNHKIRDCRDSKAKKEWCTKNRACFICCSLLHRAKDCKDKPKSKEEGGKYQGNGIYQTKGSQERQMDSQRGRGRGYTRGNNRGMVRGQSQRGRGRGLFMVPEKDK